MSRITDDELEQLDAIYGREWMPDRAPGPHVKDARRLIADLRRSRMLLAHAVRFAFAFNDDTAKASAAIFTEDDSPDTFHVERRQRRGVSWWVIIHRGLHWTHNGQWLRDLADERIDTRWTLHEAVVEAVRISRGDTTVTVWVKDPRHPAAGGADGYVEARYHGHRTPGGKYEVFVDACTLYVTNIHQHRPQGD